MEENIICAIKLHTNEKQAAHLCKFFKTGKGQYAEGDMFLGLKVPVTRSVAKEFYKTATLEELNNLIKNPYHEIRLAALFMLILKYEKGEKEEKEKIFNLYLENIDYINNWDLVDLSAPKIVGDFTFNSPEVLYELANTNHLWSQRISIVSTLYFIKKDRFDTTLRLSERFLNHKHDLIHKATGWMLREVGKRDLKPLYCFLDKHHKVMPRTMLRYSIEKLSEEKRKFYMQK